MNLNSSASKAEMARRVRIVIIIDGERIVKEYYPGNILGHSTLTKNGERCHWSVIFEQKATTVTMVFPRHWRTHSNFDCMALVTGGKASAWTTAVHAQNVYISENGIDKIFGCPMPIQYESGAEKKHWIHEVIMVFNK